MEDFGLELDNALRAVYGRPPAQATLQRLGADASTRTYFRYRPADAGAGPHSLLIMHLPDDPLGSDEASGDEKPAELPFLDIQRLLAERGVRVPAVYHSDLARRIVLLEDLGDETFAARLEGLDAGGRRKSYEQAVDLLSEMHEACRQPGTSIAYERAFDRQLLRWELDHFREWGLEAPHGPLQPSARPRLDAAFDRLTEELLAMPQGFVHRDYQSRNLMWTGEGELAVIDFQDALQGPAIYDLCALLCDSYVDLDEDFQVAMVTRYAGNRDLDAEVSLQRFHRVTVQRKLKDAGRFVYIDRVRGNPGFLKSYPQSLTYVARALGALPGYAELEEILRSSVPGYPDHVQPPPAHSAGPG